MDIIKLCIMYVCGWYFEQLGISWLYYRMNGRKIDGVKVWKSVVFEE